MEGTSDLSDKIVGRLVPLVESGLCDSGTIRKDGETQWEDPPGDKDSIEKAAVCPDGPPIRWEQGRNPTRGLMLVLEMPSVIEISSWHEIATVSKVDRL